MKKKKQKEGKKLLAAMPPLIASLALIKMLVGTLAKAGAATDTSAWYTKFHVVAVLMHGLKMRQSDVERLKHFLAFGEQACGCPVPPDTAEVVAAKEAALRSVTHDAQPDFPDIIHE